MKELIFEETLPGGATWSWILKRRTALRILNFQGGANVSALFFNAENPMERYNLPDTLKAQHIAYLSVGHVLYSDMGRILCSLTQDTCGWHDTLCGATTAKGTEAKYGPSSFQKDRNAFHRNGRDNFLVELGKHGLGKRDLGPNVNFFNKVYVDYDGNMHFVPGFSRSGSVVELRAEMNVLVVLSNTPHPLDPARIYAPKPVHLQVGHAAAVEIDDPCRVSCPENSRGFQNTEALFR